MSNTFAKKLRRDMTEAEKLFWRKVRNRSLSGHKFRRQVPIGAYIVDFLCLEEKVVVEIDGGQHNENKKDEERDVLLSQLGYCVIRFWNNDVLNNLEGVLSTLTLTLSQRERENGGNLCSQ